ncbi:werner syndrome ATP-dependent helicase, partial [Trifolium medium]|nr:werner syndrome ATP-dependent helicase [Trifolium medium]
MAYIVLAEAPQQNLKRYGVYVGEASIPAAYAYHQGNSTKPLIIVTVTATASTVTQWLSTLLHRHRETLRAHHLVVGLGVQWTHPNNNNNNNNNPNPSTADTLQLCIGFWNDGDRWRLSRSDHCLELFRYPMDLRYKAVRICNEDLSLAKLDEIASKCLGFQVEQKREIGMSNW